jgi:hypothetical protein
LAGVNPEVAAPLLEFSKLGAERRITGSQESRVQLMSAAHELFGPLAIAAQRLGASWVVQHSVA